MSFSGNWHPVGVVRGWGGRRPNVGDLVAYDYRAWEVTHVQVGDFGEADRERASRYREPYRDQLRPYRVTLRRVQCADAEADFLAGVLVLVGCANIQSHGCWRGCSPQGHPGTRVAGRPADPRAVWS